MSSGQLKQLAAAIGATLQGGDVSYSSVSTDTRDINPGAIFVALRGPHHDGHNHVTEAIRLGAVAVVVETPLSIDAPQLVVANTRLALADIARHWRQQFDIPFLALTGSNGKTSVKTMMTAILSVSNHVLATKGNFNNDIGVPLTLLRLQSSHEVAVIELGANHHGEIDFLSHLVQPDVALITNAGSAHLEGFGSVAGVAKAKSEIFNGLKSSGTAVLNRDDQYYEQWRDQLQERTILTFGEHKDADFRVERLAEKERLRFSLTTKDGFIEISMNFMGRHHMLNAAAAAAAVSVVGISLEETKQGLEAARSVDGRLQVYVSNCGARLIDDTYNANPDSAIAAIEYVSEHKGENWLVLGDMGELGAEASQWHAAVAQKAKALGFSRLFTYGRLSKAAALKFGGGAEHFDELDSLIIALSNSLQANVNVLVKASRAMRLERVIHALVDADSAVVNGADR